MIIFRRSYEQVLSVSFYLLSLISFCFSFISVEQSWARNPNQLEYQFKAGFLTNFARLITWPTNLAERTTLNLCVLDPSPFGDSLASIEGKLVLGKKLVITVSKQSSQVSTCQILFVNSTDKNIRKNFIDAVKGKPVVIVGETPGFAQSEGMINFIIRNKKIRFEINRNRIEEAGLRVSSRLLKYGILVNDLKGVKP